MKAINLLLVLFPGFLLLFLLKDQVFFNALVPNDLTAHAVYIRNFTESFRAGSLGLEFWDQSSSGGFAVFRIYQNLAHMGGAVLNLLLGGSREVEVCAILIALSLALQTLAFWKAALWMGFSKRSALVCAWISPVLASGPAVGGHQLINYLVPCFGLYTQSLVMPVFVLAVGYMAKGFTNPQTLNPRFGFITGVFLGLTFLLHQFYGYLAFIAFVVFFIWAISHRPNLKSLIEVSTFSLLVFLFTSGYQLWSVWNDFPLLAQSPWLPANRTLGIGFTNAVKKLFLGGMLDHGRLPVVTFLSVMGLGFAFSNKRPKVLFPLLVTSFLFLLFLAGPRTFGNVFSWIPGLSSAHLDRFVGGIQVVFIFVASLGVEVLFLFCRNKKFPLVFVTALVVLGIGSLWLERNEVVSESTGRLNRYRASSKYFDYKIFSSLGAEAKLGNLWGTRQVATGEISLMIVSPLLGYNQFGLATQGLTYTSFPQLLPLDRNRKEIYEVFNLTGFLAEAQLTELPSFLKPVYRTSNAASFVAPTRGFWDLISVASVETTKGEITWLNKIDQWLKSSDLNERRYPAVVPEKIAKAWPSVLPSVSSAISQGVVLKNEPLIGNKASATFQVESPGAFGLLRVAFHPRWKITVDGKRVNVKWVGPAQVGFPLEPGIHEVKAEFPRDLVREGLFFLFLITIGTLGIVLFLDRKFLRLFHLPIRNESVA